MTVQNTGDATATNIDFIDLPENLEKVTGSFQVDGGTGFVDATDVGLAPDDVELALGSLEPGESVTVRYRATTVDDPDGPAVSDVGVFYDGGVSELDDAVFSVAALAFGEGGSGDAIVPIVTTLPDGGSSVVLGQVLALLLLLAAGTGFIVAGRRRVDIETSEG